MNRELLDAAALCGYLLAEGSVHAFLVEHRHRLFPDGLFADSFPTRRGRPSVPADVIATVMVLQALEGRSDREAITALQTDLGWKAAAGLASRALVCGSGGSGFESLQARFTSLTGNLLSRGGFFVSVERAVRDEGDQSVRSNFEANPGDRTDEFQGHSLGRVLRLGL